MKLQLKRSNVLDGGKAKEPTPPYVEYGELCVNYNVNDPALFIKDSNDNIIRIAGKNSVGSGSNPSGPNNPGTGNNIGDVFFNTGDLILYYWDGNQWVPIASQEHAADIYVGTFAEVDVEIPVAERRNGLLLWETEEGNLFLWYIDADTAQWVVAVPGGGSGGGGGSSNVTVLDVAPNNPKQGDLWYCTNDGRLYIYYEDINTSQWVDASPDNLAEGFWERDGTTLKPVVAGDDVDLGAGSLSANKVDTDDRIGVYLNNPPATPSANVLVADDGTSGGTKVQVKANGDVRLGAGTGSFSRNSDGIYLEGTTGTVIVTKDDAAAAGTDSAVWRSGQFGLGETITLNADGNATFGSTVNTAAGSKGVKILGGYGDVQSYSNTVQNTSLNAGGNFFVGYAGTTGTKTAKCVWHSNGDLKIGGTLPGSPAITLNADGTAKLNARVDAGIDSYTSHAFVAKNNSSTLGTIVAMNKTGNVAIGVRESGSTDNAQIKADGTANFKNLRSAGYVVELEPDDPANFTAEGEYTGPTLDVKDRILNLISRLDALEANEVIDDATDTSLLQLLASASSRLDSIEARLTALEGGN